MLVINLRKIYDIYIEISVINKEVFIRWKELINQKEDKEVKSMASEKEWAQEMEEEY